MTQALDTIVDLMKGFKRPLGHRLGLSIMAYVANYPEAEGARPIEDALADQVEMRLLPKLRGIEVDAAAPHFSKLQSFVKNDLKDDDLAKAIEESMQSASDTTGQFVWSGVTR